MGLLVSGPEARINLKSPKPTDDLRTQILDELRSDYIPGGILDIYTQLYIEAEASIVNLVRDPQYNDLRHPTNIKLLVIILMQTLEIDCKQIYIDPYRNVYYVAFGEYLYEVPLSLINLDFSFEERLVDIHKLSDSVENLAVILRHADVSESRHYISLGGTVNRIPDWLIKNVIASRMGVFNHGPNWAADVVARMKVPECIVLEN